MLALIAASILIGLAAAGALFQQPHPDPFRVTRSWDVFNLDWWRYPVEQNAFKRLPVIRGNLKSVFVLPGTQQVWAAGNKGLIIHSADGGKTWEQQRPALVPATASASRLPALISSAHAAEPGAQQTPAQQSPNEFLNAPNPSIRKQAAPPANQAVVEKPAKPTPRKEITAPLSGPVKGSATASANLQAQQPSEPTAPVISPPPGDAALNDIFFTDATRGWAVGSEGTILATTDAGRNWQIQTSGTSAELYSVQFIDTTRGWAVGAGGTILATTDAGRSWQMQTSGTNGWLTSVQFLDATRGWAVGIRGSIHATTDGGRTWQRQTSGTSADLWSVQFLDATRGWAVGEQGTILTTADAGRSWQAQTSGTTAGLDSVQFLDAARGWAVGDAGTILATTDAGRSWQMQTSDTTTWLYSVQFIDATRGWAVGSNATILATADAGRSWQMQTSDTTTWLYSVQFLDATRGWAVGTGGTILATTDAGRRWQAQTSGTTENLFSVQFLDATRGWAVGRNGTILTTADAGRSWQMQSSGTTAQLSSVQFVDATRGWVVGDNGTILTTADGGKTWADIRHYRRSPAPWVYAQLFPALLFAAWAVRRRPPVVPPENPGVAGIFVSDRPLAPGDVDHLGHGVVARGLANFIRNENTEPGVTVAVTGAWGLGKSSVMRLLEDALTSAGFRTAWFNAWHHQQEGRQLASMLNAIRRQAIPPVYSFKGFALRAREQWHRGWLYRCIVLLFLSVLAVAVWELSRENKPWEWISQNFNFHVLKRQPTVLTETSLRQIEKDTVVAADVVDFMRKNMLWNPVPGKGACLAVTGGCVFNTHEQLLVSLARQLNRQLSVQERSAITNAAHHLPPPPWPGGLPAVIRFAGVVLLLLLGSKLLGVLLLLFVAKSSAIFGLDTMSSLLERFIPGQQREPDKEEVGTLEQFRDEFERITETLQGRLVLFIDDLDRCDCVTIREVLEKVNYLVSTGHCFVILGMAMEHIKLCIKPECEENSPGDYANQYLKKLINIEVPVPVAPRKRSRHMLEQQATKQRTTPFNWPRWSIVAGAATISAVMMVSGIWFSSQMTMQPETFRETQPNATTTTLPNTLTTPPAPAGGEKTLPDTRDNNVGVQAAPEVSLWPSWLVVILAAIFVVVVGVLSLLPRERVHRWLEKLFKRAKIAAGGAERTVDSHDFVKALTAWHDVIALGDSTPRGIKRFVNRVRLFAMRERAVFDDKTEAPWATLKMRNTLSGPRTETPLDDAILVALAALHHVDEQLLEETLNAEKFFEKGFNARKVPSRNDGKDLAAESAIKEHEKAGLPWPPTPEQIARFKEIAQGFHIH